MTVAADPEGVSARTLAEFVDLGNKRILEIGCGKGRLTYPLAEYADFIIAIDPVAADISKAIDGTPAHLRQKIDFLTQSIAEYQHPENAPPFDLSIFTWSL